MTCLTLSSAVIDNVVGCGAATFRGIVNLSAAAHGYVRPAWLTTDTLCET